MAYVFPSQEWVEAFKDAVNNNPDYRTAAKTWEGDFYFVVEPDASSSFSEPVIMYMDLWHGECREAYLVTDRSQKKPEFVISAPYSVWKQVVTGKLDPIKGLMTRKLKLQGNMMKIMRAVKAANELVRSCTFVPTEFADKT